MKPTGMDRREFHQLTVAALGGVIAGTSIGCNPATAAPPAKTATAAGNDGLLYRACRTVTLTAGDAEDIDHGRAAYVPWPEFVQGERPRQGK